VIAAEDCEAHQSALVKFLRRLLLRSPLSDSEQNAILSLPGEELRTSAHRDIARPGHQSSFSCLVVKGLAGRFDQLANGRRQITALHIVGDFCDLHSVVVPETGWGIESLTDTVVRLVPHEALKELIHDTPQIALAFWRDTVVDASILAKWNSALGRRGAKARLAHLLCGIGLRFEQAKLAVRDDFRLELTQSQLADVLGVTPVHLNRTMQALRRDGLLKTKGSHYQLPDRERLMRIAQFDDSYLLLKRAIAG
jgi:CRP-like cAMP-binding protein